MRIPIVQIYTILHRYTNINRSINNQLSYFPNENKKLRSIFHPIKASEILVKQSQRDNN